MKNIFLLLVLFLIGCQVENSDIDLLESLKQRITVLEESNLNLSNQISVINSQIVNLTDISQQALDIANTANSLVTESNNLVATSNSNSIEAQSLANQAQTIANNAQNIALQVAEIINNLQVSDLSQITGTTTGTHSSSSSNTTNINTQVIVVEPSQTTGYEIVNDIYDIDVQNSKVYISGDGFIARSDDYGQTYQQIVNEEGFDFNQIKFINETQGYYSKLSGNMYVAGTLKYTEDSGFSWSSISTANINNISTLMIANDKLFISYFRQNLSSAVALFESADDQYGSVDSYYPVRDFQRSCDIVILDLLNNAQKRLSSDYSDNLYEYAAWDMFVKDSILFTTNIKSLNKINYFSSIDNSCTAQVKETFGDEADNIFHLLDFNNNFGFNIGGDSGKFQISTNGGNNWTNKYLPELDGVIWLDVIILSDDSIYLVGNNGNMMRSLDLGLSFQEIDLGTDKDLRVIKQLTFNKLIIGGEDGFISIVTF